MRFGLIEAMDNKIFYRVEKEALSWPRMTKEGVHLANDLDTCISFAETRHYENPHYYRITLKDDLNSVRFEEDLGQWRASDIAKYCIAHQEELQLTSRELITYEFMSNFPNGKSSVQNFEEAVKPFVSRGYNSFVYTNTYDTDEAVDSFLLFSPELVETFDEIELKAE